MLSEAEMKEFFQRVVDSVATLSSQASKVAGLETMVHELSNRIGVLEDANNDLRAINTEAANNLARMEADAALVRSQLESERNAVSALREIILQRDSKVQELESRLQQERDGHKITTSERDDARTKAKELEDNLEWTRANLAERTKDRDHWQEVSASLERETSELRERLNRVNSILNPIRAVSADVA